MSIKKGGGATRAKAKEGNPPKGYAARSFTFKDLALATQNFREANLIGEGGFGSVYKGRLESGSVSSMYLPIFRLLQNLNYLLITRNNVTLH